MTCEYVFTSFTRLETEMFHVNTLCTFACGLIMVWTAVQTLHHQNRLRIHFQILHKGQNRSASCTHPMCKFRFFQFFCFAFIRHKRHRCMTSTKNIPSIFRVVSIHDFKTRTQVRIPCCNHQKWTTVRFIIPAFIQSSHV